jgi:cytochrome c-type biogenesis protein CcmH
MVEATVDARRPARASRRHRKRRGPVTWQLVLSGLALFGVTAGTIYLASVRHASRPAPGVATSRQSTGQATDAAAVRTASPGGVQRMIDDMSQRVRQDPKDRSAWALLAHSYDMLGRFDEASRAHARLAELMPGDAQVLADYADALAASQGRRFEGEPERLLKRALALDPKNVKALLLSGTDAFDHGRYGDAIRHWERVRSLTADATVTREVDSALAQARALAARSGGTAAVPARPDLPAGGVPGRDVAGRVTLAPALMSKVAPDDTVFVFARSALGSRMPVALMRRRVRDLPLDFRLDDSMAMVPDLKLSSLSAVVVGARVSKRGDAVPQRGDLQGLTPPVAVGSRDIRLQIAEVLE